MPETSAMFDEWSGICCCHPPIPCIGMTGYIIEGSDDCLADSRKQGRLTDMTIGYCGHVGNIVSASTTVVSNGVGKARIGDQVTGCNIGNIITGIGTFKTGG